jgi:FSR family fosmidomycin resistance protein-like MFS transporter
VWGGWLAGRFARVRVVRWSYAAGVPALAGLVLVPGPAVFGFVAVAAVALYVPFSLHVTLGQDYLPGRVGTASGVTLGLAVSLGGIATPVLGAVADAHGLETALAILIALPAAAAAIAWRLRDPTAPAPTPPAPTPQAPTPPAPAPTPPAPTAPAPPPAPPGAG